VEIGKLTGGWFKQEDQISLRHNFLDAPNVSIRGVKWHDVFPKIYNMPLFKVVHVYNLIKKVVKKLFMIKMTDAKLWKSLISAISALIDEAGFNIDPSGIKLRAMDPSHIAMIDFEWPKNVFEEFVCDQPINLCINVNEMLRLLRRIKSDESLHITLDEKLARLTITLIGSYTRTFSIPTLDTVDDAVPTPKLSLKAKIRITTNTLKDAMDDASTVSDHIKLIMTNEKFVMNAQGNVGNVLIEIPKESEVILDMEAEEESTAMFSLNYLSEMIKAASALSEIAIVEFSTDMPIKLNFELPQGGKLQYYLAPRIENP
jgi:proliferating cell nuclear antigen